MKEIDLKIWVTALKAIQVPQVERTLLVQKEFLNHVEEVELTTNDFQTLLKFRVHVTVKAHLLHFDMRKL